MVTIILPISRKEWLRPVFDCLNSLERPDDTELIIITDGDKLLEHAVNKRLDSIGYSKIRVIKFGDNAAEDLDSRRYRISAIHNKAKQFISYGTDLVFLLEDDTIYLPETLKLLMDDLDESIGFVQGVELGRRKTAYVGGWRVDNIESPNEVTSVMPSHGTQEIDAGGLYCCLIPAHLYKEHSFEPYDKHGTNGLSCDVNFGLYIRNRGYKCLINWSVQCDHIGDKGSVNLGNTRPVSVQFTNDNNKWTARTL